ncbi:MAG: helix-hairpin-helix domain-containing protein [Prevotella sp.]|nr:helix-hairpin-helix domain-containing protein [Prevotella sp.]MBQ8706096.1 helix-hairpin-helix domain-containing protein [Paludibacteraceae bacterium]
MRFTSTLVMLMLLLYAGNVRAQDDWDDVLDSESLVDDDGGTDDQESLFEILSDFIENPIDINNATPEELEQLPFLTAQDIEGISEYIYRYGPMKSVGELSMIESIDARKRNLLSHFIFFANPQKQPIPSLSTILHYGHHKLMATMKVPFYKRKGDDGTYLGDALRHNLRYNFNYGDKVRIGLVGAKAAGEPFFKSPNSMGYDFYSFYARIQRLGILDDLIVGRYRVRFGAGLVINNDFTMGKIGQLTAAGKLQNHVGVHSSTNSSRYLQGVVTTLRLSNTLSFTPFVSYRYFDATLNNDGSISSIPKSVYHRTETELKKKNNTSETTLGGHLSWRYRHFRAGATFVNTTLDRSLQPSQTIVYRRYYPSGRSFTNASIDYAYVGARLMLGGETAIDKNGALATLNTLSYRFSERLSTMILQRFYSKKYQSIQAQSFSEGGGVQNESGIYAGVTWKPLRRVTVTAYTDLAYFPWPKYQASLTSHAWDNLVMIEYASGKWKYNVRYRLKLRERDNADKSELVFSNDHRLRCFVEYKQTKWSDRLVCDLAYHYYKVRSRGWMLSNQFNISLMKWAKINASVGYFHTDDYNTRIYCYEKSVLYSFNIPAYYGEGIRYSLLLQASPSKSLSLYARLSTTNYFDRSTISSGNQEISGSSQTDLELQAVYKF